MTTSARWVLTSACVVLALLGVGCEQHELGICDITTRPCQVDIYYRMLSLRGDGYDPFGGLPPVNVITESQFRDMLIQEAERSAQDGPDPWDRALALLHFTGTADPNPDAGSGGDAGTSTSTIDEQVTHIYAFYDPQRKSVTIISHPNQTDPYAEENAMVTLAHELVHALQDRELDLNKEDFHTSDEYLAYDTIIEGDARFYEYLFVNQVLSLMHRPQHDIVAMPTSELQDVYENYSAEGTPLFVAQLLVYSLGATYEALAYQSGGNAAIRHGYGKEPHHMVGFLQADDGKPLSDTSTSGDICPGLYATSLPTSGNTVGADQFGALLLYAFLRGWNVDHPTALATAQTWTGDFLLVQAKADVSVTAVSWLLEFSAPPPSSIAQTLSGTGQLSVTQVTNGLQITATDSPSALNWAPVPDCR
jgi:hypothetical protein